MTAKGSFHEVPFGDCVSRPPAFWTEERYALAKAALAEAATIAVAAEQLSRTLGRAITVPSLQTIFRDRGDNAGLYLVDGPARRCSASKVAARTAPALQAAMGGSARMHLGAGRATPQEAPQEAPQVARPHTGAGVQSAAASVTVGQGAHGTKAGVEVGAPALLPRVPMPNGGSLHNCRVVRAMDRGVEPIVIISDVHAPYEDKLAVDILEQTILHLRPKYVVAVGDFADLAQVSSHIPDPAQRMSFTAELEGARNVRMRIDAACERVGVRQKIITLGNHETRLVRLIRKFVPQLEDVIPPIETLLGLSTNGWHVVDYGDVYRLGDLYITHDISRAGKYAHEQSRIEMGGSTLIGHTHRMSVTAGGTFAAGRHVAAMCGWLGNHEFARYMKRPQRSQWQLGFGVGWLDTATGYVTIQGVPIVDYRAVVAGKLIVARSAVAEAA